jgi:hypothetical protein
MIAVTLRYLVGVKMLDLGWPYGLRDLKVFAVTDEMISAMDAALQNVTFPATVEYAEKKEEVWQRLRGSPLYGIISALDGIAVEIRYPTAVDCSIPTSYYNRKGFYVVCEQATILANYNGCFPSTKHSEGERSAIGA